MMPFLSGLAIIFVLTGCTGPSRSASPLQATSRHASDVPKFEGPWAAEFAEMYGKALTDDERDALHDGRISEQEFAEVNERFLTCVRDTGMTYERLPTGGGLSTYPAGMSGQESSDIEVACSISSGDFTVGSLYFWTGRNPDNQDDSTIVAQCLVNRGLVEKGYNAARYDAQPVVYDDVIDQNFDNFKRADECIQDPLGLLTARE